MVDGTFLMNYSWLLSWVVEFEHEISGLDISMDISKWMDGVNNFEKVIKYPNETIFRKCVLDFLIGKVLYSINKQLPQMWYLTVPLPCNLDIPITCIRELKERRIPFKFIGGKVDFYWVL